MPNGTRRTNMPPEAAAKTTTPIAPPISQQALAADTIDQRLQPAGLGCHDKAVARSQPITDARRGAIPKPTSSGRAETFAEDGSTGAKANKNLSNS